MASKKTENFMPMKKAESEGRKRNEFFSNTSSLDRIFILTHLLLPWKALYLNLGNRK